MIMYNLSTVTYKCQMIKKNHERKNIFLIIYIIQKAVDLVLVYHSDGKPFSPLKTLLGPYFVKYVTFDQPSMSTITYEQLSINY